MEVRIIPVKVDLSQKFLDYVDAKLEKLSTLAEHAVSLTVKVTMIDTRAAGETDRVELTIQFPGHPVRAEALHENRFTAFDTAYRRLVERIRRYKGRRIAKQHGHRAQQQLAAVALGGASRPAQQYEAPQPTGVQQQETLSDISTYTDEAGAEISEEYVGDSPIVVRRKTFVADPINAEEAIDRMELLGHDFYLFHDSESGKVCAVYRRTGWHYGVISLDKSTATG